VYVDDCLNKLKLLGCRYKGISVSAIMYADDIVLMSPSVTELQNMINVCCNELALVDLRINSLKSNAIRIGNRFRVICANLYAFEDNISWANEAKYLGIWLQSAAKFRCNFDKTKTKYYRAANGILAKVGEKKDVAVTLQLLASIALPILMYSLEALMLNKTELNYINHPWTRSFEKLFLTFDKDIVQQCQHFTGYFSVIYYYCLRTMDFYTKLETSPNILLRVIYNADGLDDISRLASMFECDSNSFKEHYKSILTDYFNATI